MAESICQIPYKGEVYELNPRDITVVALRQAKAWYGPEYGRYISFVNLFLNGDADAVAVAIWICLKKKGINREPQNIDFSPFDIFEAIQKANEDRAAAEQAADAENPDAAAQPDPTPSSEDEATPAGTLT